MQSTLQPCLLSEQCTFGFPSSCKKNWFQRANNLGKWSFEMMHNGPINPQASWTLALPIYCVCVLSTSHIKCTDESQVWFWVYSHNEPYLQNVNNNFIKQAEVDVLLDALQGTGGIVIICSPGKTTTKKHFWRFLCWVSNNKVVLLCNLLRYLAYACHSFLFSFHKANL